MACRSPRGEHDRTRGRRPEILDAALAVFSSSGFHGGSLRDIARRAGLSQAGLLHHFPSKEHLLRAVLARRDDVIRRQLGEPVPDGLDLVRRLAALPAVTRTRELVRLHVITSAEGVMACHPVHGYVRQRQRSVLEMVSQALERAAAHGDLRGDVDCAGTARTLVALMDGLQVQWLLDPEQTDIADDLRRCLQPLLAAGPEGRGLTKTDRVISLF
jgi:AcrR family transcriptional regulator